MKSKMADIPSIWSNAFKYNITWRNLITDSIRYKVLVKYCRTVNWASITSSFTRSKRSPGFSTIKRTWLVSEWCFKYVDWWDAMIKAHPWVEIPNLPSLKTSSVGDLTLVDDIVNVCDPITCEVPESSWIIRPWAWLGLSSHWWLSWRWSCSPCWRLWGIT